MKSDEFDAHHIAERLEKIHIEQTKLHKEELKLIKKLTTTKRGNIKNSRITEQIKSVKKRGVAGELEHFASENAQNTARDRSGGKQEGSNQRRTDKPTTVAAVPIDRHGNVLKVGDEVEFLTEGLYKAKVWKIYKLTKTRAL
jgi:hypothetical protein